MDYRNVANSIIADYEIGNLCIDYANSEITIVLKSPQGIPDVLCLSNFEKVTVTRAEPWGAGKYVAGSGLHYCEGRIIVEIELNSGDQIRIAMKNDEAKR